MYTSANIGLAAPVCRGITPQRSPSAPASKGIRGPRPNHNGLDCCTGCYTPAPKKIEPQLNCFSEALQIKNAPSFKSQALVVNSGLKYPVSPPDSVFFI